MGDRRFRIGPAAPIALLALALPVLAGCNPMASWTNNQNGKAFYRAGRYAEAREEFRRAAADSPRNPDYIHNYATASRRAGDAAAAEQAYRQALSLDPAHQPSYHGLAVTLKDTGRVAEAQSLLSGWAASQPYSEKAYIEMAWLQREMGDHTGAERSLAQALRIKPSHPLALANLGQIYEETGRGQLAVAAYQKSLASDWNQPQVASRVSRLRGGPGPRGASGTAIAAAPGIPVTAVAPGPIFAGVGPPQQVASLPGDARPMPLPPYRPNSGGLATNPYQPTAAGGLATRPFTSNPNIPLAADPFRPNPNIPLAAHPFTSSQALMNVPTAPHAAPGMFSPSGTAAPIYGQGQYGPVAAPYVRQPR